MSTFARRMTILLFGLAIGVGAGQVSAQVPQLPDYGQSKPEWTAYSGTQTMSLLSKEAKLGVGLGVATPAARLHVIGDDVQQKPGTGSLIVGAVNQLHMQIDRNELRVAGPAADEVGALHLQRFGGPVDLRVGRPAASQVVFPAEGGLAVGGSDPYEIAVDLVLWHESRPRAPAALAVDGYAFADISHANEGHFLRHLRVGPVSTKDYQAAYDSFKEDAVAMIGGLLTAQSIMVHVKAWADDVFSPDYELMSLADTRAYIDEHHRLPGVPSEQEVRREGLDLGAANELLLRKIEELTLHAIAQQEQIDALKEQIDGCK